LIYTFQLNRGDRVAQAVDVIHKRLEDTDMQSIIDYGMHEFLDVIQLDLIAVAKAMDVAYFG
jgi:hypothetical protein